MRPYSLLLPLLLGFAGSFNGLRADDARPNVLFLICDDLNCDLGCYGHPLVQSPNIDRLAKRGVRFAQAHCQYPLCGPSRASFMTGMYPDQTLIHRNSIFLRATVPNVVTMSESFRNAGYFATRIGKIYHYGVPRNIGTGGHDDPLSWDKTINPRGRDKDEEAKVVTLVPGQYGGTLSWLAADGTDEEQTDGIAATEAVRILKENAETGKPFYLAVGLYRPHTPYVAPKDYFAMYPREKLTIPTEPDGYLDTLPVPARKSIRRKKDQIDLPDETARKAIQAYYASITFADAQLGRILDTLDATGLSKNTIVLFTSDHGYHMGEHGHWQKTTLFENATRVPLIIAGPGVTSPGATTDCPAEMVDFHSTLTDLAGVRAPKSVSGRSLVPTLANPKHHVREGAFTQYANGYSLRTPRYRYTEWGENGAEGNELYDHETDAPELVNVADDPKHAETVAKLSDQLRERIAAARKRPAGVRQLQSTLIKE